MSKINVYSSSASNAIKVFDANSTGLKPDNAILVTTGTEPSNAIQINIGEQKWSSIAVNFGGQEPTPPGPTWETVTIGNNVWMAENLSWYDESYKSNIRSSACVVNDVDFGTQYFYNKKAITIVSSNFPGWHIPTQSDVELLYNDVEGNCESLRTTAGWVSGLNGTDLKGFHAEPLASLAAVTQIGRRYDFPFLNGNNLFVYNLSADNRITSGIIGGYAAYYPIRLVKD